MKFQKSVTYAIYKKEFQIFKNAENIQYIETFLMSQKFRKVSNISGNSHSLIICKISKFF
jgi:hypothetical protein